MKIGVSEVPNNSLKEQKSLSHNNSPELAFGKEIVQMSLENFSSSEEVLGNLTQTPVHDYSEVLSQERLEYERTS